MINKYLPAVMFLLMVCLLWINRGDVAATLYIIGLITAAIMYKMYKHGE